MKSDTPCNHITDFLVGKNTLEPHSRVQELNVKQVAKALVCDRFPKQAITRHLV